MSGINLLKCCCTVPCDLALKMSLIKENWRGSRYYDVAYGDVFEVVSDFPTGCFSYRENVGCSMNFDGFSLSYDLASKTADIWSISVAEARTRMARCWENGRFYVNVIRVCLYDKFHTCYPHQDVPYGDLYFSTWSSGSAWSSGTPAYVWTYNYKTGIFEVEGAPITVTVEPGHPGWDWDSSVYYQPAVRIRIYPEV